jgi:DNA modification methylase
MSLRRRANYNRVDLIGDYPAGWRVAVATRLYILLQTESQIYRTTEAGRRCVKSVITIANKKGKGNHPTQKPDDLYKWLIERYSKEGDTVLDPTAGSFASVFTAQALGRNAIGIEMDDKFYEKAVSKNKPAEK